MSISTTSTFGSCAGDASLLYDATKGSIGDPTVTDNQFTPIPGLRDQDMVQTGGTAFIGPVQDQRLAIVGGGAIGCPVCGAQPAKKITRTKPESIQCSFFIVTSSPKSVPTYILWHITCLLYQTYLKYINAEILAHDSFIFLASLRSGSSVLRRPLTASPALPAARSALADARSALADAR